MSPKDVMNADNYGETGVDHAPVFFGQKENDEKRFFSMYGSKDVKKELKSTFTIGKKHPQYGPGDGPTEFRD